MKEKSNLKSRIGWLDLAKTLAIFSIVANHAVNRAYPVTVNPYQDHLFFSIERAVIFAFSRIGVPFFFMITGALLLPRNYENDLTLKKFYKNNYLNLLVTSEIWIIIMYLTIILWNFKNWEIPSTITGNLLALFKAMLFNSSYTYGNIWYLPKILMIYLFIPVYSLVLMRFPLKITLLPLGVSTFFIYMRPTLSIIFPSIDSKSNIYAGAPHALSFQIYLIYLIIGYLVSQGSFKKLGLKTILLYFFLFSTISILMIMLTQKNGNFYDFDYNNLFLLLMTTFAFESISRIHIKKKWLKFLFTSFAKKSFGIYFIHIILMEYLFTRFDWSDVSRRLRFIIFEFGTILASYLIISLLAKNKKIAKWLFMIK